MVEVLLKCKVPWLPAPITSACKIRLMCLIKNSDSTTILTEIRFPMQFKESHNKCKWETGVANLDQYSSPHFSCCQTEIRKSKGIAKHFCQEQNTAEIALIFIDCISDLALKKELHLKHKHYSLFFFKRIRFRYKAAR